MHQYYFNQVPGLVMLSQQGPFSRQFKISLSKLQYIHRDNTNQLIVEVVSHTHLDVLVPNILLNDLPKASEGGAG